MTTTSAASFDDAVLLPLSPMDAIMGSFGFAVLYIFPRPRGASQQFDLEQLHASFKALVEEEYRILLGELHVDPTTGVVSVKQMPGGMTASTIPFERTEDPDTTTDDAMVSLSMSFMPARDATQLVTIKATLLSDGGLVLGVNMSHTLLDGEGMFTFMKVWGEFYRSVTKKDRTVICHDRALLAGRGVGSVLPHPEFKLKLQALVPPASTADAPAAPPVFPTTTQHVFHVSPEQLKQLKTVAMDSLSQDDGYVSTTDALTALCIILISQARGHGKDVKFTTGVNARKRFSPPLPDNYAGNVISNAFSQHTAHELETLSGSAIANVAKRVRQSILQRDEAFLRDAIEFITSQSSLSDVLVGTEFFFGPDLMFTSWANFGMYDADFGARPWYVGVPKIPICDGMMIIMEGIRGAEGLDLVVLIETNAMARLKELWASIPFWSA